MMNLILWQKIFNYIIHRFKMFYKVQVKVIPSYLFEVYKEDILVF